MYINNIYYLKYIYITQYIYIYIYIYYWLINNNRYWILIGYPKLNGYIVFKYLNLLPNK